MSQQLARYSLLLSSQLHWSPTPVSFQQQSSLVVPECQLQLVLEPELLRLQLLAQSMGQLKRHRWPGNLREFAMTVENALVFTFAELANVPGGTRPDVVQLRPKLLRDLLRATATADEAEEAGWKTQVSIAPAETLNRVASEVERQYFVQLYILNEGDFRAMASVLLGDPELARKVQLRFNQLGLKVRELKQRIG